MRGVTPETKDTTDRSPSTDDDASSGKSSLRLAHQFRRHHVDPTTGDGTEFARGGDQITADRDGGIAENRYVCAVRDPA